MTLAGKSYDGSSADQELSKLLQGLDGSAIIYVMTKKEADTLAVAVRHSSHPASCSAMLSAPPRQ